LRRIRAGTAPALRHPVQEESTSRSVTTFARPTCKAVLAAAAVLAVAGAVLVAARLRATVRRALEPVVDARRPLQFLTSPPAGAPLPRWGSPSVEAVAVTPAGLLVAGGSGVVLVRGGETVDLTAGLPGLAVSALAQWRGDTVVGLKSGGLFRRHGGGWEEARSGWGTLEVRALAETEAGELLIGARQGLFRAAWGANSLERLDSHPVRSMAESRQLLLAGGEQGLFRVEPGRAIAIATPDPWIDEVALAGAQAYVVTASGLLRGDARDGPMLPLTAGDDVVSGVAMGDSFRGLDGTRSRAVRAFSAEGAREDALPRPARRLLSSAGTLFADTTDGLYRRDADGWTLAAPRQAALPPGPAHVTALAFLGSDLVAGLFDGGLVVADAGGPDLRWHAVPGSAAWGVNALLPAGGALYVASLRGAARFDGRRLTPIEGPGAAFSLASTADGVAIGYGQGVLLPGPQRLLSAFHGLPGNQALALAYDDVLYVGTPSGLGAIGGQRVRFRVAAGEGRLPHPWVTALALSHGALYVGTYGGGIVRRTATGVEAAAGRVDRARYEAFVDTEGLKINAGCLVEAQGRLYAGTDGHGLYRLSQDGRTFEPVRVSLPSRRVTALLPAPGALYVGTDEGVARLPLGAAEMETR
jgi:hypothetical protein